MGEALGFVATKFKIDFKVMASNILSRKYSLYVEQILFWHVMEKTCCCVWYYIFSCKCLLLISSCSSFQIFFAVILYSSLERKLVGNNAIGIACFFKLSVATLFLLEVDGTRIITLLLLYILQYLTSSARRCVEENTNAQMAVSNPKGLSHAI